MLRELWLYIRLYIVEDTGIWKWMLILTCVFGVVIFCIQSNECENKTIFFSSRLFADVFLTLELAAIITLTLSDREMGTKGEWMFMPFWSWKVVLQTSDHEMFIQILANIILFIPLGILLPCCFQKCRKCRYTILYACLLSFVIELIQGIAQIGFFETDDIIHNTLGACVGVGGYIVVVSIRKKWRG